jgi:hypothetical protein
VGPGVSSGPSTGVSAKTPVPRLASRLVKRGTASGASGSGPGPSMARRRVTASHTKGGFMLMAWIAGRWT